VAGQPTRGGNDLDAVLLQTLGKGLDELGAASRHLGLCHLLEADGHGLDFLGGHAAVGRETFVCGKPRHQVIEVLFVIGGDEAATGATALAPDM
jgi:hypothetical protein